MRVCIYIDIELKNTRNKHSNIFVVLDAFKSLLCFPLDFVVNVILNSRTN